MKKIFIIIIFLTLSILVFPVISNASSSSSLFLNSLNIEANIQENGDMKVCEYWNIDIKETNTLYKTFYMDSSKFSGIEDVHVSLMNLNAEVPLTKAPTWAYHMQNNTYIGGESKYKEYEICWGVGLDDSSDTRLYKIEYTVKDVISKYNDCAELYWQFVGNEFEIDINKISGTITLPTNAPSKDLIHVWGHTKNLNGTVYATASNEIKFDVGGLNAGTFMEVRVAFPESIVNVQPSKINNNIKLSDIIEEETTWANEANQKRLTTTLIFLAIAVFLDILLIYQLIKNTSKLKNLNKNYIPFPQIEYFRDIPNENYSPAEALKLQKKLVGDFPITDFGNIFSATLLNLHLKGFISIEFDEKKKTIIRINTEKDIQTNPNSTENEIYNFIQDAFENNTNILLKELQIYIEKHSTKIEKLRVSINSQTEKNVCNSGDYDLSQKKIYTNCAISNIFFILAIFLSIFLAFFSSSMVSNLVLYGFASTVILSIINITQINILLKRINIFTKTGKQHCSEWNGLKKFMEDFSMLDKREVPEIVLWEKYLVYATVFNVADEVIKQLKIVYPELQDSTFIQNYAFLSIMTNNNFTNDFSKSINTSISSAYSSGSGSGGGFSGGGGFGGGRRWRRR